MTRDEVILAFQTSLPDGGWPIEWADAVADDNLEIAAQLPAGSIITRKLDNFSCAARFFAKATNPNAAGSTATRGAARTQRFAAPPDRRHYAPVAVGYQVPGIAPPLTGCSQRDHVCRRVSPHPLTSAGLAREQQHVITVQARIGLECEAVSFGPTVEELDEGGANILEDVATQARHVIVLPETGDTAVGKTGQVDEL